MLPKKQLIKISSDIDEAGKPYPGRYKNENGIPRTGIFLRRHRRTIEKLFINNGHLMRLYRYPGIDESFFSPMVNDYNLHLCGGWSFPGVDHVECLSRVFDGKKPMGFHIVAGSDKRDEMIAEVKKRLSGEFKMSGPKLLPRYSGSFSFKIGVSTTKTFVESFDMKALSQDYRHFANTLGINKYIIEDFLTSIESDHVSDYLDFDYANPHTIEDLVLTGLILGYSINSTVAIIWEQLRSS